MKACPSPRHHRLTLDLWLAKDNRFLNPKSSYKRILMAPSCRFIFSLPCIIWIVCLYLLRSLPERVSEEIERRDRGKGLLPRSSASFITRKAFPYPFPIASPCNTFGVTSRDWVRHEGKGKESLLYHSPFPSLSSHPLGSLTANINSRTKMGWREDGKRWGTKRVNGESRDHEKANDRRD